jgi:hypothetical protein
MNYTNKKIGYELKALLEKGYDIVKISRWAFSVFYDHTRELDPNQYDILQELFRMEDDPQFEYTEKELKMLAEMLIKNEKDPLKHINNMKNELN